MTDSPQTAADRPAAPGATPRDDAFWAPSIEAIGAENLPSGVVPLNVAGRQMAGPLQGFGQMWRKRYRIRLASGGVPPAEVITTWKAHFGEFWPKGNRFYGPLAGLKPGEVAVLNLDIPGPIELSTGVFVIYADDVSFTFMTPQGHTMAGWITFSAVEEGGATFAQAEVLMRASDPIYEVGMLLFVQRKEDAFWRHTLRALATRFGTAAEVEIEVECVDPRRQWRRFGNVWQNAGVRTVLYVGTIPIRGAARRLRRGAGSSSAPPASRP